MSYKIYVNVHTCIHTMYKACQQCTKNEQTGEIRFRTFANFNLHWRPCFHQLSNKWIPFLILLQIIFWLYDICYSSRTIFIVVLSNFGHSSSCLCILMIIFLNLDIEWYKSYNFYSCCTIFPSNVHIRDIFFVGVRHYPSYHCAHPVI